MILSTGELVACVCIECFTPLEMGYIIQQRRETERAAYCKHQDRVTLSSWGSELETEVCTECSAGPWRLYFDADGKLPARGEQYYHRHEKARETADRLVRSGHYGDELYLYPCEPLRYPA